MKSMAGFGGGVASLGMRTAGGASIVTDDLKAYLDFGDTNSWNGSSTSVNDLSGNSNGGTLVTNNGSASTQYFSAGSGNGGYIRFNTTMGNYPKIRRDGTDFFDDMGLKPFTLEFWLRPYWVNTSVNYQFFVNHAGSPYTHNFRIALKVEGSNMQVRGPHLIGNSVEWIYFGNSSTNYFNVSSNSLATQWTHLVYVRNGPPDASTNYKTEVFINGNSIDSNTTGFGSYNQPSTLANGRGLGNSTTDSTGESTQYRGDLAIYRFYLNRALSSSEITQNFDAEKERFGLS